MESLFNLLWLTVATLLFAMAVRAQRRDQLNVSLPLALGCVALLSIVIFPALSMTDDLQRARLDVESTGQHLGDSLRSGSLKDQQHEPSALLPIVVSALFGAGCVVAAQRTSRDAARLPGSQVFGNRSGAIRPPPRGVTPFSFFSLRL